MNIYTVHVNPKDAVPLETAIYIKEGFSWLATMLTIFWMGYHRIWWAVAGIALFYVANAYVEVQMKNVEIANVLEVAFLILIGFHANDWYRETLKRRGYVMMEIVSGKNEAEAEQRFLDFYLGQAKPLSSEHARA